MLMRAEDKAKWVAALRSGKYSQCEGTLTSGGGYCCLGVMEKVLGTGEVEEGFALPSPQWCANNHVQFDNQYEWEERSNYVDEVVDDDMTKLAAMNDGKKKYVHGHLPSDHTDLLHAGKWVVEAEPMPFPEIADWIEKNVGTYNV